MERSIKSNVEYMELYQLRSFLEVVGTSNLTKAATNLHISQSALSSQIKLLEEEFGISLFDRTSKGMVLSEKGRLLLSSVENVVESANTLKGKVQQVAARTTGTFRLGLNTNGMFLKVSKISRKMNALFPEVNFIFVASETMSSPDMLRQNHMDLGFFFGTHAAKDIVCEQIATVTIRIVIPESIVPAETSLNWPTLARLPWIWSDCACPYYETVQAEFDKYNLVVNKVVEANDEGVVQELLLDSQGVALLREDDAVRAVQRGGCYIWPDATFEVPLSMGLLKRNMHHPTMLAVTSLVKEVWGGDV